MFYNLVGQEGNKCIHKERKREKEEIINFVFLISNYQISCIVDILLEMKRN